MLVTVAVAPVLSSLLSVALVVGQRYVLIRGVGKRGGGSVGSGRRAPLPPLLPLRVSKAARAHMCCCSPDLDEGHAWRGPHHAPPPPPPHPCTAGVEKVFDLPSNMTDYEKAALAACLPELHKSIDVGVSFVKGA